MNGSERFFEKTSNLEPLKGALVGAGIGGITSLINKDEHPIRDAAIGAGLGGLTGHIAQSHISTPSGTGPAQPGPDAYYKAFPPSHGSAALDRQRYNSPEQFFKRTASLAGIVPSVAAPALGGYAGRAIGARYPGIGAELGGVMGAIGGGIGGQLIRERVEGVPPGAPYALDPTSADIPPWALQGAHMLQPMMKQGGHFGDIVGGDLGGLAWPVADGLRNNQSSGDIAKNVAGQGLGTLGGGLIGHGVGHVIDKVVGHPVMGPLNIPLTTILSGLGATMGNVKGLEFARR